MCVVILLCKQKTAYDLRISDWSSDVGSSDLLAVQIGDSFKTYGRNLRLRHAVILGGVAQGPQVRALSRGVDILIATPGRLMDLLNQRHVRLDSVSHLVQIGRASCRERVCQYV